MRRISTIFLIAILFLQSFISCASPVDYEEYRIITTSEDSLIFEKAIKVLYPLRDIPTGELMYRTALQFKGTPYVAGTLETFPDDPVINLHETDCILFVEMCTAIVSLIKENECPPDFNQYCRRIIEMRYRKGQRPSYGSRLHYTSEWIIQNSEAGIFKEMTSAYGIPLPQEFNFMTGNSEKYPALEDNPQALSDIKKAEARLNGEHYFQIPSSEIQRLSDRFETGDIVCFVSKVKGLDITHTGIIFIEKGIVKFIHASMRAGAVTEDPSSLRQYCKTGIRLVRLN